MKKKIMLILTLAVLFTTVPAIALSPQVPEVIIRAVAGQTFEGRCTGYESVGGNFSIYVKLYERARYSVEDIKAVGETDYIDADIGSAMVYSVTANEDGYILNESDPNSSPVYMIPDGNGCFYAQDAEGHFFMKEALEISCPIAADAELNTRANRLGRRLRERGFDVDQLCAVLLDRSVDVYVARQGVLKAGGAFLPIDPEYPDDRLSTILEDAGCGLVVTSRALFEARGALLKRPGIEVCFVEEALDSAVPSDDLNIPVPFDALAYRKE